MVKYVGIIGLMLALGTFAQATWAAGVEPRLDRSDAVVGETVTLILETDDSAQGLDVDLSPLEGDFAVLGQRTETQMSIVNGRQSAQVRLLVTLEPLRAGTLAIPALSFPGGRTRPLTLEVAPPPERAPGEPEPVFIEVQVEPADGPHYVHAQMLLTVRVFYQRNLTEAALEAPRPEPAAVRLLDDVPFQAERNGVRYQVSERRYAVFPERSGPLTIPPVRLSGRLVERDPQRLWQQPVRGRRITVASEPLTLEIQPRPAAFNGAQWLPARRLEVASRITDVDELKVGEPLTRTIIVDAVGLEEHMISAPEWPELPNARIYPDQPQGITRDDGRWVLGHKEFRYAVVPEQPGTLELPELTIEWWDTEADRARTAVIPAQSVEVAPAASPAQAAVEPVDAGPALPAVETTSSAAPGIWPWLTVAFALLWLGTLGWALRRGPPPRERPVAALPGDERERLDALRDACRSNDAAAARRALSDWLRHHGPALAGGSALAWARVVDDERLAGELRALQRAGFDGAETDWRGGELWQAFDDWRRRWNESEATPRMVSPFFDAARRRAG